MADHYRVLVTGSRTWRDEQAIRDAFASVISILGPENVTVVHGAARQGADAIADRIATAWNGVTVERHPADWDRFGNAAGQIRNQHMLTLEIDEVLAFIDPCADVTCPSRGRHGSHGAARTADLAEKAGIPTRRFPEVS